MSVCSRLRCNDVPDVARTIGCHPFGSRHSSVSRSESFYWHDYETSGADPRRDRPVQFAGLRTDAELNPIDEPLVLYCQPTADVLHHPEACLITGITPQQALAEGVPEPEFAARVHAEFAEPGTCGVGYNNLRFDDEVSRHLFYRNFYDPYAREWQNGNSRFDLIDVLRMSYALRPEGLHWPEHEPGVPSFRLGELAAANGVGHSRAHDALSDVEATLGLARCLRDAQPRLWQHALSLRSKSVARGLLNSIAMTPVVHVSARFPARRGCLALMAPLCDHPVQRHSVIAVDLAQDPGPLLELDADDILDRLYTPQADLPEAVERIALKLIHCNRAPMLAPASTLKDVDTDRFGLNGEQARAHLARLRAGGEALRNKLREIYGRAHPTDEDRDAELALYGGSFLTAADQGLLTQVRQANAQSLATLSQQFQDLRYRELLFRYRARHYPQTLDLSEQQRWQCYLQKRLMDDNELGGITWAELKQSIDTLKQQHHAETATLALLDHVLAWGQRCIDTLSPVD